MGRVAEFRALLEAGDLDALVQAWGVVAPHLPVPAGRAAAEAVMHHARTQTASLRPSLRCYSHAWLSERGLPSALPETLKPVAARLYPVIRSAVGIAVKTLSQDPHRIQAANDVRRAMELAVEDAYANGDTDPAFVSTRMDEARRAETRRLYG